MKQTLPAFEARRQFGRLLDDVAQKGDRIVIERHGREIAAVVPIAEYRRMERERLEAMEFMRRVSERSELSPDEADALALEAVREVRALHRDA